MNLDFLCKPMGIGMRFIYDLVSGMDSTLFSAYALTIIISTLIIKVVVLPLTLKQTKSMKVMQDLSPRIKELQAKYGKDPQTLQRKQAELYKESGYNPLSGCLPLLIQLPLVMAFFYIIKDPSFVFGDLGSNYSLTQLASMIGIDSLDGLNFMLDGKEVVVDSLKNLLLYANHMSIDASSIQNTIMIAGDKFWIWETAINRSFFWINDLSFASNIMLADGSVNGLFMGFSIPFVGAALPILAGISGYSTYITTKMTSSAQAATAANEQAQQTQKTMSIVMPIMIFVMGLQFPAGLALYWSISNCFQLVQQSIILRAKNN